MQRAASKLVFWALAICFLALPLPSAAQDVDLGVITVKQKSLADSIRQRLLKGESFESLARAHSVSPTASRGGRLGIVPETRLRGEFKQALAGLRPGHPSVVVPTEEGYSILMRFGQAPAAAQAQALGPAPALAPSGPAVRPPSPASPAKTTSDSPQLAARLQVMAGLEQMVAGDLKKAEARFSQALGLNPREDSANFLLEVARGAISGRHKTQAASSLADGFIKMFDGRGPESLAAFRQARQQDPGMWQAGLFEANMLAGMGKREEAGAILHQLLKNNPRLTRPHLSLGMIAIEQNQLEQAALEFRQALAIDPDLAEAHYRLGNLALSTGKIEEAERELKAAVASDPYKEEAHNDLGLVLGATGRGGEAEKEYQRAMELNPAYVSPYVNLGQLYAQTGRLNQAVDEFNKALALDPGLGQAHNNLAVAYTMKEDWALAIQHADMAVKLGTPVPEVLLKKLAPHRR